MEEEAAPLPEPSLFSSEDEEENFKPSISEDGDFRRQEEDEEEDHRRRRRRRRSICWSGCGRPNTTCICPFLPLSPIPTSTHLIILHHPHELRANKLATLPALSRSLIRCHSVPGRRLQPGSSPLLDCISTSPALFLFPTFDSSTPALDLEQWAANTPPDARVEPILIVFDATWTHAKEMVAASIPFLSRFAMQVQIGGGCDRGSEGPSTFESGLVLRKEPWKGCLSTIEAVARALRVLEPEGKGVEIEERLLAVLRAMVAFKACHLKLVKPRPRLKKKGLGLGSCPPTV